MTNSGLLTTGDVARLCGFSTSAVLQWIRRGKLPAYSSPGGQHRVSPEQLTGFLREHGMRVPTDLVRSGPPYRVLIVEDEEFVRDVVARTLADLEEDCVVDVAENGVVGCMKIPVFQPHLILLDLLMPEVDGVELCRAIKSVEETSHIKILVVTGADPDDHVARVLQAGADDWIAKPFRIEPLLAKVRGLLGMQARPTPRAAVHAVPASAQG